MRDDIFFSADDSSKLSWSTHDHIRTIRFKYMTPANCETYARQYPCDGWVDTLEPTFMNPYSLFSDSGTQSELNH